MGKGRSNKPNAKRYLDQIEWENQRRSSPKGYYGKWFDPAWVGKKYSQSPRKYFFAWAIPIGVFLFFLLALFLDNGYSVLPGILLLALPAIIILLAIRDAKRKS